MKILFVMELTKSLRHIYWPYKGKNKWLMDFNADLDLLRGGISLKHSKIQLPENSVTADLIIQLPHVVSNDNAFQKLSPEEYFKLVQSMICQGQAFQKKAGIHAIIFFPLLVTTQNSDEGLETKTSIPVVDKVIVIDAMRYSLDKAEIIKEFIFSNYSQMLNSGNFIAQDFWQAIDNGNLTIHCDIKGYGIWTMSPKNFKNDYEKRGKIYKVKKGTTRFCMDVDRGFVMPSKDGEFLVRKNGTVAARTEELTQIIAAINDVQSGKKTILEAFYTAEGKARFDIYGMDPNFRRDNYDVNPQPVPPLVHAALQEYRSALG